MKRKQGVAPFVSEGHLQLVLTTCEGHNAVRNRAILLISYNLGLRAKEIAALSIGDVFDLRTGQLVEVIRLLRHMTKGDKFREVPLVHRETREALVGYLSTRGRRHAERPLFISQRGERFSANTMQRLIGNLYRQAGIPGSSHSGRRSFATRLIEKGADIYAIQQLMGHTSITTTQKYLFASTERLKKTANLLN